jgi:heme exporter protein B
LGFPLIIPCLLLSIKSMAVGMDDLDPSLILDEWLQLGGLILISGALSILLFPYLWRS